MERLYNIKKLYTEALLTRDKYMNTMVKNDYSMLWFPLDCIFCKEYRLTSFDSSKDCINCPLFTPTIGRCYKSWTGTMSLQNNHHRMRLLFWNEVVDYLRKLLVVTNDISKVYITANFFEIIDQKIKEEFNQSK